MYLSLGFPDKHIFGKPLWHRTSFKQVSVWSPLSRPAPCLWQQRSQQQGAKPSCPHRGSRWAQRGACYHLVRPVTVRAQEGGESGESGRQIWIYTLALPLTIPQLRFEANFLSLSLPIYKQGIIISTWQGLQAGQRSTKKVLAQDNHWIGCW